MTRALFCDKNLGDALRMMKEGVRQSVLDVPEDQFLSSSVEEIRDHLLSKLRAECLVLYEDKIQKTLVQSTHEVRDRIRYDLRERDSVMVPSLELVAKLPYSGPQDLFYLRPSMFTTSPPVALVGSPDRTGIGFVTLRASVDLQNGNPEELQRDIDHQVRRIRDQVRNQKTNIDEHNAALPRLIDENVEWRRKNYAAYFAAAEKLNIAL